LNLSPYCANISFNNPAVIIITILFRGISVVPKYQ
jgi:hypothetical protein